MNLTEINPLTLPSISINEIHTLPECVAIYFVIQGNDILYVGKTKNLYRRWFTHHVWNHLCGLDGEFQVAWLECSEPKMLLEIEKALIQHFKPAFNHNLVTKRPRTTISFDDKEYKELEEWAESEFRSVPQLISVIVKKALIERKSQDSNERKQKK